MRKFGQTKINTKTETINRSVAAISCSEVGGGGGDGIANLHLATLLVSESWQQYSQLFGFWYGGGGASPQMYHITNHIHVTYMHERAKRAKRAAPQKHNRHFHMVWLL